MSSNKSPGNQRSADGSKQGNEQNSEQRGATPMDQAAKQGGASARQGEAGKQRGQRNGSESGKS